MVSACLNALPYVPMMTLALPFMSLLCVMTNIRQQPQF